MAQPHVQVADIEWPATISAISHAEAFDRMVEMYGWDVQYWRQWRLKLWSELLSNRVGWSPSA